MTGAIESNARSRGAIGAAIRANDSERKSLLDELESVTGDLSRVQDTDYAAETAAMIRSRLLQQVGTMLEKSNIDTQSQTVLKLIEGATKAPNGLAS